MKKKYLFSWMLLLLLALSCSDDKDPIIPPAPDPVPPTELKDGLNFSPQTPEAGGELTITFKASSSSALYNYTGDVYVHIGVVEGADWFYVPAAWNENIDKCKMTKTADNVWSITLAPSIREWFGAAADISIQKIGVVFRSADGAKKGIEADSFIAVTDTPFTPGETVFAPLPDGVVEGINIHNESSVTLVLYDKDKDGNRKGYAYVIGDFNNWTRNSASQMKRDENAGCWWITLNGLNGQTEYAFQYYVGSATDGALRLADAYAEKILDPANDPSIPASTYPGLRDYPSGKTAGIVSTFKTKRETYNWTVGNFKVKDKNNLIIYEMLFRDFTATGDINGAMQRLDYLQSLGVNAIELMPVQEFDGNDSWGYNPCFYFAMDKAYGTKQMYQKFIDECHKRDMAVILDVVYNHATGAHPFAKLYWNGVANKTASHNPWFNVDAPHPYSVFHDFNHESDLVRKFVKRNLQFLLEEYKVDGFRFDLSKGFTQKSSTEGTAGNYDATRVAILKDYNAAIKAANPDAVVILEHFAEESEEKALAGDGMQLWRNRNHAYCQTAMGWVDGSAFTDLTTIGTTMPFGGWIGYMESHDEERAAYKQIAWGATDALKTDLTTRMSQLAANASLFFTVPGPKMVWQFGELGYDVSIDENGRTGKKPVKWEYYDNAQRKGLHDVYSRLIKLRTTVPGLFNSESAFVWNVAESNWAAGRTLSLKTNDGKGLVVAANFTSGQITCPVTFPSTGTWYNYMRNSESITVDTEQRSIQIPAHSFYVYTTFP